MVVTRTCSKCGASIPKGALNGICPVCSLQNALGLASEYSGSDPSGSDQRPIGASIRDTNIPDTLDPLVRRFGDYELLEEIARGGMGVVYKARQVSLGRIVALKMLLFGSLARPEEIKRFRAEASTAASLQHANIVGIHEVGVHEDQQYLVMDYVEGPTLAELVAVKPLTPKRAATYLKTIAEAIHYAHERGILHRDLKPSNILVDPFDQPKVTDFGLAKRVTDSQASMLDHQLTVTGQVLGSPNYMAPEQAARKPGGVNRSTDVYALGAILYHLLTGRPPFAGETLAETLKEVLETEPVSPRLLNTSVPRDLDTVCLKCLEKEPRRRYPTAQELADELGRLLQGEPIHARRTSATEKAWRWCQRRPTVAVLAGATLLLLVTVLIGSPVAAIRISRARDAEARERLRAEQRLYAADMNLAHQAWEDGDLQLAQNLLRAHLPQRGEPDPRGWEWRYLWKLCRDESRYAFTNFSGEVRSLALSPSGGVLAAGGEHVVKLLNMETGQEIDEISDPEADINCVAFSPANTNILATTGGADNAIKIWSLATKKAIARFSGHPIGIASIAFSPDGGLLASAGVDDTLKLFNAEFRTNIWTRSTLFPAQAVVFAKDGETLISGGGENGNPIVWKVASGTELPALPQVHSGWVTGLAFSPDGQMLASVGNDSRLVLWDFTGRLNPTTLTGHRGPISAVGFSPDSRLVASVGEDHTIRLWDVASRRQTAILRGHVAPVTSIAFSLDGATVISGSLDHSVRVWDLKLRRDENVLKGHTGWITGVTFSPNAKLLAAVDYFGGLVKLWDVPARRAIADLTNSTLAPLSTAFSPDGQMLAAGYGGDFTVMLWDLPTLKITRKLTNNFDAGWVAFSPDSKVLAVAGRVLGEVKVHNRLAFWDVGTGQKLRRVPEAMPDASVIVFSDDGQFLATGHRDGSVQLWDSKTQRLLKSFHEYNHPIWCLAFSKDSTLLASSGDTGSDVIVYDVQARRASKPFKGHVSSVWGVTFTPDGRSLVSASHDGTVKIWNLATQRAGLTLKGHVGPIDCVAFTHDESLMATGGADGDVRLWPTASNAEIP
jgi:WD40 repeat protein